MLFASADLLRIWPIPTPDVDRADDEEAKEKEETLSKYENP